ncbi:MAG: hypothetical protein MZV63_00885 [Marinilabiliales bacterium]|nr:hypothetical protein [Marinilabiliales bacterium]
MWVKGFLEQNPGTEISLLSAEKSADADIRFVTGNSAGFSDNADAWKMVVGRDVIVPVIHDSSPFQAKISEQGISPEQFAAILTGNGSYTWGELLNIENRTPVTVLMTDDNAVAVALSKFVKMEPGLISAKRSSSADITAALQNQQGVIAFCRLADITDQTGQGFAAGMQIIPIDINSNASSDYFEQFYADYNSFSRGVYIGKYPKALCNNIYAVSASVPAAGAPSDLISYILADGQRYLAGTGFTALARGEGIIKREALVSGQAVISAPGSKETPAFRAWLWVLAVIATVSLLPQQSTVLPAQE